MKRAFIPGRQRAEQMEIRSFAGNLASACLLYTSQLFLSCLPCSVERCSPRCCNRQSKQNQYYNQHNQQNRCGGFCFSKICNMHANGGKVARNPSYPPERDETGSVLLHDGVGGGPKPVSYTHLAGGITPIHAAYTALEKTAEAAAFPHGKEPQMRLPQAKLSRSGYFSTFSPTLVNTPWAVSTTAS